MESSISQLRKELDLLNKVNSVYDDFIAFYTSKNHENLSRAELAFIREKIYDFVSQPNTNGTFNAFKNSFKSSQEQLSSQQSVYVLVEHPNTSQNLGKRPRTLGNVLKNGTQ